jgi:hypothetical protein
MELVSYRPSGTEILCEIINFSWKICTPTLNCLFYTAFFFEKVNVGYAAVEGR